MNIILYNLTKRINSTKRPASGSGSGYDCTLKDPTSVLNPVVLISASGSSILNKNYAYIDTFGRYYWITDVISDHNMWEIHLSVDTLATYKTDIESSYQYVLRSASKINHSIPDTVYPITTDRTVSSTYVANPLKLGSGTKVDFVLGVLNFDQTSDSKINGVQYLILSESKMRTFMEKMLTQDYFGLDPLLVAVGWNAALLHDIVNPAQYIVESYVLPHSAMGSKSISQVKLGPWNLDVHDVNAISEGYSYNVTTFNGTDFTIPSHPQAQDHGIYLNSPPYSHHVLHAGPFGDIPLDFIPSDTQATVKYKINMDFKGNCQLLLMDNDLNILATSFANASVPIPVIATSDKSMQGVSTLGSEVSSGITSFGMSLAGSPGRLTNAIVDFIPTIDSTGINAGVLSINQEWYLTSEFYKVAGNVVESGDIASGKIGAPLCETVQLSTLNGFTQCDGEVDISINAYEQEISNVRSFMSSGFFIES